MGALIHSGQTKRQVTHKIFSDNWDNVFGKKDIKEEELKKDKEDSKEGNVEQD
jgi:hypothetical protein